MTHLRTTVLSFSGVNHGCTLPWPSVFALTLPQEQVAAQIGHQDPLDGVVERPVGVVRVLVVGFRVVEVRIDLDRSTAWSRPGR